MRQAQALDILTRQEAGLYEQETNPSGDLVQSPSTNSPILNLPLGVGDYSKDAGEWSEPRPTSRSQGTLQVSYREMDIIQKAVNILIDDALANGINFLNLSPEVETVFRRRMEQLRVWHFLRHLPITSRTYGDGYLYLDQFFQRNSAARRPLEYQPGQLRQLILFDGFEIIPDNRTVDRTPGRSGAGIPQQYFFLRKGAESPISIHPSRLIRMTHVQPPSGGWLYTEFVSSGQVSGLNRSYCGSSLIHTILNLVMTELEGVGAAKKLTAEASMKDLKMEDFDTINPTQRNQRLAGLARDASNWSVFAHPAGTELSRVAVSFQGLQGILERNLSLIHI